MLTARQLQFLQEHPAAKKWYRSLSRRAAVSLVLDMHAELGLSLLMIERAQAEGDPWSGQMAFPGGKADDDDSNITVTALRESFEELAIGQNQLRRIARLSDILARPYRPLQKPMVVSPLLFTPTETLSPVPNEEVAGVHWLPVAFFQDPKNRQTMQLPRAGVDLTLPCYTYEGRRVWGLSLMMIDELLRVLADMDIHL
jgi:8-oxo-dGTP pyrophosphatase MutT (NUDIX family)